MDKIKVHPSIYSIIETRLSDFNYPLSLFESGEDRIRMIDDTIESLEQEKRDLTNLIEQRKNEILVLRKWLDTHEPDNSQSSDLCASAVNPTE